MQHLTAETEVGYLWLNKGKINVSLILNHKLQMLGYTTAQQSFKSGKHYLKPQHTKNTNAVVKR